MFTGGHVYNTFNGSFSLGPVSLSAVSPVTPRTGMCVYQCLSVSTWSGEGDQGDQPQQPGHPLHLS